METESTVSKYVYFLLPARNAWIALKVAAFAPRGNRCLASHGFHCPLGNGSVGWCCPKVVGLWWSMHVYAFFGPTKYGWSCRNLNVFFFSLWHVMCQTNMLVDHFFDPLEAPPSARSHKNSSFDRRRMSLAWLVDPRGFRQEIIPKLVEEFDEDGGFPQVLNELHVEHGAIEMGELFVDHWLVGLTIVNHSLWQTSIA